jgi:NAD(P)H-hydrate repair Nnr-like enzyme with NAD(P)H-hydrate epimerase domain
VDAEGYVFGVLGGHPRDDDWAQNVAIPAAQLMEEAGQQLFDRAFHGVYYGTCKQEQRSREKAKLPPP